VPKTQIDIICKESVDASNMPKSFVAQNFVKTCMHLTYINLTSDLAQCTFIASLPTIDRNKKYYGECTIAKKKELDAILQNCNHGCWQGMLMVIDLAKVLFMLTSYAHIKMLN
jgi:hypothetical protein